MNVSRFPFLFLTALFLAQFAAAGPVASSAGAAVSIVDDTGKTISLAAPARRIIPLYAGLGESLMALGLEDRLVGRTVSDNTVPERLPSVGTHMRPTPELVRGLSPDLVVQLEGREEAAASAAALSRAGVQVARFRIATFADLFSCVERLGTLTGTELEARALVSSMRERLADVARTMEAFPDRPGVFFEVRYPNLLGAGGASIVNDIITAAGGGNCLAGHGSRMVRLSEEALVLHNPLIYLVQEGPMNKSPLPPCKRPAFRSIAAVKTGFVRTVPESLYSRPGPGSVDAVEDLAKIIMQWHISARPPENGPETN